MKGHTNFVLTKVAIALVAAIALIVTACDYDLDIQKNVVFNKDGGVVKLDNSGHDWIDVERIFDSEGKVGKSAIFVVDSIMLSYGETQDILLFRDSLDWLTAERVDYEPCVLTLIAKPNNTGRRRSMKVEVATTGPRFLYATINVVQE